MNQNWFHSTKTILQLWLVSVRHLLLQFLLSVVNFLDNKIQKSPRHVSEREWALYQCQDRRRFRNRVAASGNLGQLFVIDLFCRLMHTRYWFIQEHHTEYMKSTKLVFDLLLQYSQYVN